MREKLLILMKSEGLTASRLAELLGIGASGISHILGGRNKPKLDFIEKLLRRFPKINPDWLLLDGEQMYRDNANLIPVEQQMEIQADQYQPETSLLDKQPAVQTTTDNIKDNRCAEISQISANATAMEKISYSSKAIKRVIILYADHTFESYEG